MNRLLPFLLLPLLLAACAQTEDEADGGSLLDLYDDSNIENIEDGEDLIEEEVPYSEGPTEIPDDLVLPE